MRAVVLSDSHGDTASCERALDAIGQFDMIIHLGDIKRDVDYIETMYYPKRVVSVLGNNDFCAPGEYERIIDFDGHRIFLCHGHTQAVSYGTQKLVKTAMEKGCAAALFGHTHVRKLEKSEGGILIVNPGSVARPRGGAPSFAVLETDGGKLSSVIVDWVL